MKTEIIRLNHNGEGIGQIDGKIVFVPKTIPGDIVEVSVEKNYKNFIKAKIENFYQKSDERVPISCPYYHECGGCQLMGLSYSKQLLYKKEKVRDILSKYANLDVFPNINESPLYKYRNKITFQVQDGVVGLYSYNTNKLVPIKNCLLISDNMNYILKLITDNVNLSGIKQIVIREANEKIMVQFIGNNIDSSISDILLTNVASCYINDKHIFGEEYLIDNLGNYEYQVSPNSFFQINHIQTESLYKKVLEYLGDNNNHVLDLYCGTGSIGIYVSKYCNKITGIELSESSVNDAIKNIKRNKLEHIHIKHGDVGKLLEDKNTYDAIIVDPPRSGLDKRTKQVLLQIKSAKIIYVSCDPITLARDLNELKVAYDVKEVSLFDMFPNTYHVESVVWLSLKK